VHDGQNGGLEGSTAAAAAAAAAAAGMPLGLSSFFFAKDADFPS